MTTNRTDRLRGLRSRGGFTVLEMLVSLAMMAIVLGVATPSLTKLYNQYQMEGLSRQVALEISKARMQAIAQNRTVRLRLKSLYSYVIEASEDGATYTPVSDTIDLPPGMLMIGTGSPTFNRQGMAPASTLLILVKGTEYTRISTTRLGRVTRS